jgi:hypothetical protein
MPINCISLSFLKLNLYLQNLIAVKWFELFLVEFLDIFIIAKKSAQIDLSDLIIFLPEKCMLAK